VAALLETVRANVTARLVLLMTVTAHAPVLQVVSLQPVKT